MADFAPANTSRFQYNNRYNGGRPRRARPKPRVKEEDDDDAKNIPALGYESMDDIGVQGIKPKCCAVRFDTDSDDLLFAKSDSKDSEDNRTTTTRSRGVGARRRVRMMPGVFTVLLCCLIL